MAALEASINRRDLSVDASLDVWNLRLLSRKSASNFVHGKRVVAILGSSRHAVKCTW